MTTKNQTTPAGEGFPVGFQIFNKPGNKLIHPTETEYYVLNADNKVIAFGPQLSKLWDYAVKLATVQPITKAEQIAVSPTAAPAPIAVKTTIWPVIEKKPVVLVQKVPPKNPPVIEKKPVKKTAPKITGEPGKKRKKRDFANVVQMFSTDMRNGLDQFVRLLGAREPVEVRKQDEELRFAYIDPQWARDRQHPSFKAVVTF